MLDCDILFGDGDTLGVMIAALEHDVTLDIATSLPVKHVEIDAVGLLERLSARTNDARLDAHAVCGQLYAARASVLRQVHMPIGLEVEDGLIRAMVLTDGFRGPERLERVRRVGDARHIYEAHVTPKLLIRHEAWLIRELVKLRYLCVAFEALPLAGTNRHAGELIATFNAADANWFAALFVAASVDHRPLVPRSIRRRRLYAWADQGLKTKMSSVSKLLISSAFDAIVCARAERGLAAYRAELTPHR